MVPALVTAVYGLWLIGSGVYRHLETEGGNMNALGFGIFAGVLALIGAVLFGLNKRLPALILTSVAIVFVLGFFVTMTVKGTYPLNVRIGTTIAFSLVEAVVIFTAKPRAA